VEQYLEATAKISPCGKFRYELSRRWVSCDSSRNFVLWCMLNPSTADGERDRVVLLGPLCWFFIVFYRVTKGKWPK